MLPDRFHRAGFPALRQIALGAAAVLLPIGAVTFGQVTAGTSPAQWFAKPSELPKDVFDLPEFDSKRTGGMLDFAKAEAELEAMSDADLPSAQRLFDIFSWRAFVALNWPATASGAPDPSKNFSNIDAATPLVWEFWQPTSGVFLANGQKPAWSPSMSHALDHFKAGWRQTTTVNEGKQAFSGPLIDQNGKWVHYVSLMNREEFDYIVENELYNLEGQAAFVRNNRIEFPVNTDAKHGAIEIKLAWKVLTPAEVRSNRFLVKRLPVVQYIPAGAATTTTATATASATPPAHFSGRSADNGTSTSPVETVGLIGMHISMRTRSSPQWIWATFEQIDNTRLDFASGDAKHPLPKQPSLSNPDNPLALPYANLLPAFNAPTTGGAPSADWDEALPIPPVEVLRLVPPPQGTQKINLQAQAYLGSKDSVLRFYELNGTQWPKHPKAPAVPGGQGSAPDSISRKMPGEVVPVYLTNSTMETYFQKGYQQAAPLEQDNRTQAVFDTTPVFGTESCVGCHYSAGACIGFKKDSTGKLLLDAGGNKIPIFGENANGGLTGNGNFSWLLQLEAKSKSPKK